MRLSPTWSKNFFKRYRREVVSAIISATVLGIFSLLGIVGKAIVGHFQIKQESQQMIERKADFLDTNFSDWSPTGVLNDLELTDGQTLSLKKDGYIRQERDKKNRPKAIRDPQGYIESPLELSENSFVCTKILSYTNAIDYSIRLNKKLQVITGDGDDQTVGLKVISPTGEYQGYQMPDAPQELLKGESDPHVDHLNRYRFDRPLPLKEEFVTCLAIYAPKGVHSKKVKIEYLVVDKDGNEVNLGPMPAWTVDAPSEINGTNRFSIGLIDSRGDHPRVDVRGFCAVEMRDIGNEPSKQERDMCIFL